MHKMYTVMKIELFLIWRNWATWLIALMMILIGTLAADNNRNQPWGSWAQIIFSGLFIELILTLSTGNQVNRDHQRRLDGVVFSTPVATPSYVLGKYFAALLSLLCLTSFSLLFALLTDRFYNVPQRVFFLSPAFYPSLGPQPYVVGWLLVVLVPVIFGATFMFASITLTRGKRVIATIGTILIWLLPMFTTSALKNLLFDISAVSFISSGSDPATTFAFQHNLYPDTAPLPQFIQPAMHLSLAETPPLSLLNSLLWNRLFFIGISILLLYLTISGVQRARRSAV